MSTQNRTWQRKIINAARADGTVDQLRYYVEMDVPAHRRLRPDHRTQCANHPAGFVPTINAAHEAAEDYAHLLLELFKSANPGHIFRICISSVDLLDNARIAHYEWGEEPPATIDTICSLCGLVGPGRPGQSLGCSRGCLASTSTQGSSQ